MIKEVIGPFGVSDDATNIVVTVNVALGHHILNGEFAIDISRQSANVQITMDVGIDNIQVLDVFAAFLIIGSSPKVTTHNTAEKAGIVLVSFHIESTDGMPPSVEIAFKASFRFIVNEA